MTDDGCKVRVNIEHEDLESAERKHVLRVICIICAAFVLTIFTVASCTVLQTQIQVEGKFNVNK